MPKISILRHADANTNPEWEENDFIELILMPGKLRRIT